MSKRNRVKGQVITFGQGHGTIEGEDGRLYFVHHAAVVTGGGEPGLAVELEEGSTVEFEPVGEGDQATAQEVRVVPNNTSD